MQNKFYRLFLQGFINSFGYYFPTRKYMKPLDIDQNFINVAHYINNAYEKVKDEQN